MGFGDPERAAQSQGQQSHSGRVLIFLLAISCLIQIGCAATREFAVGRAVRLVSLTGRPVVEVKPTRRFQRGSLAKLLVNSPEPLSDRTAQLLRRYDLEQLYEEDPDQVIQRLEELARNRPRMEEIHGLAEIAEIQANFSAQKGDSERELRLYATAVVHAYQFLFDPKLDIARNAYDPQFRSICDVYNRSLEELLRDVCNTGVLQAGRKITVGDQQQGIEFEVRLKGRWQGQQFERFELVNDYQSSGLENHYHTYGLGVPLIAIRKKQPVTEPYEKYYPPDLTMPMTAFVHLLPAQHDSNQESSGSILHAVLTLYDPLEQTQIRADSMAVPLESDITTPLAYALKDPLLNNGVLATASLFSADYVPESYGMFMLEPYDPEKIPVVMAHGLWSTPVIWAHMFNDLRANREIYKNYQFWFYSYPTGQPFWITAQQLRRDLAEVRRELDPLGQSKSLKQMILVGHSMGGLISLMQTMKSEDHFWQIVSDDPIDSLAGDPNAIENLRSTFYFQPNPNIDRVITIATPLRGSDVANFATRWVGRRLIELPDVVTQDFQELARQNKAKLKSSTLVTTTSIDSLASDNPVFEAIAAAEQAAGVKVNNIIGKLPPTKFRFASSSETDDLAGDGVVSVASALNEAAVSQVIVTEEHTKIPQHPACIYEVRRILLQNLADTGQIKNPGASGISTIQKTTVLEPIVDEPIQQNVGKSNLR